MAAVRGHLKLFFSYVENTEKMQTMLRAARGAREQGLRVLVGSAAVCTFPETVALLQGLELLPPIAPDGTPEFDLDAALRQAPDLLVLDELAHTNSKSCRHRCRYQDAEELLTAGIDVYAAVSVSNLESLHDTVAFITGSTNPDRIPDAVFDRADQVELIDLEPQELLVQLQQDDSADSRITVEQLTALREVALRRCADRVRQLSDKLRQNSFHTDEHILVCLSSSPSNARIIRTAARMARAFNSQFTALFVNTPDFAGASPEDVQRLAQNRKLASQLGAGIETVFGDDVAYQIAVFARVAGVTRIVLGRSAMRRRRRPFGKPPLTEQLLAYVPETDIHIIPDTGLETPYRTRTPKLTHTASLLQNAAKSLGILTGCTLLSLIFDHFSFTDSNIIMVYILGVLLTSVATSHRIYALISSILSVIIFNFFFTEPRFSLMAYGTGYPVTFVVMFLTAYITGTFASLCKEQAGQSAKFAFRTKILYDTGRLLARVNSREEIFQAAAGQIGKLLGRNLVLFDGDGGVLSQARLFPLDPSDGQRYNDEQERPIAQWVLRNNHAAGATTDTLSDARYLYLALRVNDRVYGVVGIEVAGVPLDASEHGILLSMLGECALALENEKNAREKEAAAVLAESEQLRANLLRAISHDLRTPLTTISGNASILLSNAQLEEQERQQFYQDIYNDSVWLINLVENLLSATRIEEGRMTLRTSPELICDIVEEAVQHVRRTAATHPITVIHDDEFLFVRADAHLVIQVLVNLIDNAFKYTPAGTAVTIHTARVGDLAEIQVCDTGSGISDADKEKIFEKFFCGSHKIADNRRSLGLGLYLCKAIAEAHGGTISVRDQLPHGSIFTFTLPVEEVIWHE